MEYLVEENDPSGKKLKVFCNGRGFKSMKIEITKDGLGLISPGREQRIAKGIWPGNGYKKCWKERKKKRDEIKRVFSKMLERSMFQMADPILWAHRQIRLGGCSGEHKFN